MTLTYKLDKSNDSDCDPTIGSTRGSKALVSAILLGVTSSTIAFGTVDQISFSWTTEVNNPNVSDWPNGSYIFEIDCINIGENISFKLQLLRINSSCIIQEILGTSPVFSTTGVHTFTINTDPSSGVISDRFQGRILVSNSHVSTNQNLSLDTDSSSDAFIEGPWSVVFLDVDVLLKFINEEDVVLETTNEKNIKLILDSELSALLDIE